MIDRKIKSLIEERAQIHVEDYINIEKCCENEIELLTSNIEESIDFIINRCTGEEFVWLSEIFDEIVEKSQSEKLISALYEVAKKYPKESLEYNLISFIDSAKETIG